MSSTTTIPSTPEELQALTTLLDQNIIAYAAGDKAIGQSALSATKCLFDLAIQSEARSQKYIAELLTSMGPGYGPQTRSKTQTIEDSQGTRAAGSQVIEDSILKRTPLSSLFISNMEQDQVWAQLDLKASNVCKTMVELFGPDIPEESGGQGDGDDSEEDEDGSDDVLDGMDDFDNMDVGSEDDLDGEDSEGDSSEGPASPEDEDEDGEDQDQNEDEMVSLREEEDEDESESDEDGSDSLEESENGRTTKGRGRRHAELDDDFFNLSEFNAETMESESRRVTRGRLGRSDDGDDDDEEEEEEIDLFAPVGDVQNEEATEDTHAAAFYKDFFKVPRNVRVGGAQKRKQATKVRFNDEVRVKRIKGKGKSLSLSMSLPPGNRDGQEDSDKDDSDGHLSDEDGMSSVESLGDDGPSGDGREAVERMKDDLFAEDEEPKSDYTTFEQRQLKIKEQIAQLEAENVAEKDWTLRGEVGSRSRPQNSLLEEDLDFERVMKVVPIVTEEKIQDLESRIKERIISNNFDDVIRQRPIDEKPFLPSRLIELQDTKSSQSLAQVYEEEFVAAQTGGVAGEDRDGKLKKEHEDIEKEWERICYQLDALCNAHFTPKQPKAAITTVTNVSTITLESALPTATSSSTVLAPEEVYTVKPDDLRSHSELTPTEKQALRTKERKRRKRQRQMIETSVDKFAKMNGVKSVKKQKEEALKSVVKAGKGVTVIGKKSQELKKQNGKKGK